MTKVFDTREISSIESQSISHSKNKLRSEKVLGKGRKISPILVSEYKGGMEISSQIIDDRDSADYSTNDDRNLESKREEKRSGVITRNGIFTVSDYSTNPNNENQNSSRMYLDAENRGNEEKAMKRNKRFKSIILDGPTEFSWIRLFFGLFGIIIFGFSLTIPLTIIPYNDLVQYPEYWYELLLPGPYGVAVGYAFRCILTGSYMNIGYLLLPRRVALMSFVGLAYMFVLILTTYFIWTPILAYRYPIPFLGFSATYFSTFFNPMLVWFLFPKEWRQCKHLQKRMCYLLFYVVYGLMANVCYSIIIQIIGKSSNNYQPIVALVLPALREVDFMISSKMIKKAANGDESGSLIQLKYMINGQYVILLCIVLGSLASDATSWVLIGVDYSINIWLSFKLVRTKKRNPHMIQEQIDVLKEITICELVELLAPLAFILVFVAASQGPNSGLFGNIGNSYWTYRAIKDISQALKNMTYLFLVDFSSILASAIILWFFCKINLWKAFNEVITEFGKSFGLFLGYLLMVVILNIFYQILLI